MKKITLTHVFHIIIIVLLSITLFRLEYAISHIRAAEYFSKDASIKSGKAEIYAESCDMKAGEASAYAAGCLTNTEQN
jgi:hypothetical protein